MLNRSYNAVDTPGIDAGTRALGMPLSSLVLAPRKMVLHASEG